MPEFDRDVTPTAQWQWLVRRAGEACGTRLEEPVEAYVVFLLMRFTNWCELGRRALGPEYLAGMQEVETAGGSRRLRATGDECLLICGLFPQRVRRRTLSFSYYVDLGRGAYSTLARTDAAAKQGPFAALACGFISLMELLQAMRDDAADSAWSVADAAALARQTGSRRAWARTVPVNVHLLDPARRRR